MQALLTLYLCATHPRRQHKRTWGLWTLLSQLVGEIVLHS
jgi:hypothetical protein